MLKVLQRVREFLARDLWRKAPTASPSKAKAIHAVRVVAMAGHGFLDDHCLLRATALAYTTLLSLVPLLAVAFSVAKGFGVHEQIRPLVLNWVAMNQKEVVEKIIIYIERTNVKALGVIGLAFLVWTTIKVLGTIEASFNEIWGVKRSRSLYRKFTDYVSVLVISPILLLAGMGASAALQSSSVAHYVLSIAFLGRLMQFGLVYVTSWIAFTAIYIFMPNARVRLFPGLIGGIVAGSVWQGAFWLYTTFQVGMAKYGAIYGTFAALPIFMIWLYVSWVIVLLGAEVSWAMQNVRHYWEQRRSEGASFATREAVALRAMVAVAVAFHRDGAALTVDEIGDRLEAPSHLLLETLQTLTAKGLCAEVVGPSGPAFQPARPLEKIRPADVIAAVREHGNALDLRDAGPEAEAVKTLLASLAEFRSTCLGDVTLRDVAVRLSEPG